MSTTDPEVDRPAGLVINGENYTLDDLTFAERREWRQKVRDIALDHDLEQADESDTIPALVWVVMKRGNPHFPFEEVLAMKLTDFVGDDAGANGDSPPTPPSSSRKPKSQ